MKYFGRVHGCPLDMERIDPPNCAPCTHCSEPITGADDGFALPVVGETVLAAYHRACFMRRVIGSVAHQQKRCSCYVAGASCNDDPNLNVRQAAEAALKFWEGWR